MRTIDCVQKSPEWYTAKCGVPSASNFDRIITSKGEPSKQRTKYLYQLAGETLTGVYEEGYQNGNMLRGNELEVEARDFYSLINDVQVEQVGFCMADEHNYGASPDGLIGDDGLIQIKCPLLSTHVGYLLENKLPTDYFQQVQGEMLVTGRQWCEFVSYYPGANIKPLIIRVNRDEEFLSLLKSALGVFCNDLENIVKKIC